MAEVQLPVTASAAPATGDRGLGLTRIPPASFRGIDCSLLAVQYAAFRNSSGLDRAEEIVPRSSGLR